jgi:hypothetical protein
MRERALASPLSHRCRCRSVPVRPDPPHALDVRLRVGFGARDLGLECRARHGRPAVGASERLAGPDVDVGEIRIVAGGRPPGPRAWPASESPSSACRTSRSRRDSSGPSSESPWWVCRTSRSRRDSSGPSSESPWSVCRTSRSRRGSSRYPRRGSWQAQTALRRQHMRRRRGPTRVMVEILNMAFLPSFGVGVWERIDAPSPLVTTRRPHGSTSSPLPRTRPRRVARSGGGCYGPARCGGIAVVVALLGVLAGSAGAAAPTPEPCKDLKLAQARAVLGPVGQARREAGGETACVHRQGRRLRRAHGPQRLRNRLRLGLSRGSRRTRTT